MGLFLIIISLFFLRKKLLKQENIIRVLTVFSMILFFILSLLFTYYLEEVIGWDYGVPGADLTAHFNGAIAISKGTPLKELYKVDERFALSFSQIGYILYAYFIAFVSFTPTIFDIKFSLTIFYFLQIIFTLITINNILSFLSIKNRRDKIFVFIMLTTCACFFQSSSVLMRDIWIIYFLSELLISFKTKKISHLKCLLLLFILFLLRYYTVIITIPLYIYYGFKKKNFALISSFVIFLILLLGNSVVSFFANFVGIKWNYSFDINPIGMIKYILFPNVYNQSNIIKNIDRSYHANFGGNIELIYYLLSCWNTFVLPIILFGIYVGFKEKKTKETLLWLLIIANIAVLYAIFYSSVSEPRHKLLLLCSFAFFFYNGVKKFKNLSIFCYCISIIAILTIVLLIA